MGIRSMVQFAVRVAAFAAVAALLLQVSCTVSPPAFANVKIGTHGDSGCHEPTPSAPSAPDSSHVCCSGNHSPDALLSAFVSSGPLVLAKHLPIPIFEASASITLSADRFISLSRPPGLLALRI